MRRAACRHPKAIPAFWIREWTFPTERPLLSSSLDVFSAVTQNAAMRRREWNVSTPGERYTYTATPTATAETASSPGSQETVRGYRLEQPSPDSDAVRRAAFHSLERWGTSSAASASTSPSTSVFGVFAPFVERVVETIVVRQGSIPGETAWWIPSAPPATDAHVSSYGGLSTGRSR